MFFAAMRKYDGGNAAGGKAKRDEDNLPDDSDHDRNQQSDAKDAPPVVSGQLPGPPERVNHSDVFHHYGGRSDEELDIQPRDDNHGDEPEGQDPQGRRRGASP